MNWVTSRFQEISHDAFSRFQTTNQVIGDMTCHLDFGQCTLQHDNACFTILPIGTWFHRTSNETFTFYGQHHPTGFSYDRLDAVVKEHKLPKQHCAPYKQDESYSSCYQFAFKVCAVICHLIDGITFMAIDLQDGITTWVILLAASNNKAKRLADKIETRFHTCQPEF